MPWVEFRPLSSEVGATGLNAKCGTYLAAESCIRSVHIEDLPSLRKLLVQNLDASNKLDVKMSKNRLKCTFYCLVYYPCQCME